MFVTTAGFNGIRQWDKCMFIRSYVKGNWLGIIVMINERTRGERGGTVRIDGNIFYLGDLCLRRKVIDVEIGLTTI